MILYFSTIQENIVYAIEEVADLPRFLLANLVPTYKVDNV